MNTFRGDGATIDYTNPGTLVIASGTVIDLGNFIGIVIADIAVGAVGALAVNGVHELPATSGEAWAQGDQLFWTGSALTAVVTTTYTPAGKAWAAKASAAVLATTRIDRNDRAT
jgi:predicted RecA/RadA family phage recombinase